VPKGSVVAAAALLRSEPYYLGGLWAFTHHGLTEQQHASTIDAFVARRRSAIFRRPARLALHVVRTELLSYGIATVEVERMPVNVSDVERTLLDALDHPRLAGGMRRALDLFSTGLARANLKMLIGHAVRGSRHSTCQRVGVLLERRGVRRSLLTRLERKVRERKTLLSMIPRAPRSGRISKRWNVVENDL
jgi:predicted transcriptional regulator of viral defense system